ncbi:MAG TPA: hypothetical protein VGR91_06555 [Stellaceae bacterium]|nr:hypothetical protein [Stellaceae bacterium]
MHKLKAEASAICETPSPGVLPQPKHVPPRPICADLCAADVNHTIRRGIYSRIPTMTLGMFGFVNRRDGFLTSAAEFNTIGGDYKPGKYRERWA